MFPVCRSVTCLALLAFAAGCSGFDEPEPGLHPVLSARGRIIYVAEDSDVPPFQEVPQNARWIQQAREAQLQVQGPGPQDAPSSPQGRSEPIRVAKPDPETENENVKINENIKRLEREVQYLNAQRDRLYSQEKQEKPRSSLAERQQEDREWHQSWQDRRDQDRQEDAARHQRETQTFNDGFRELLRTQQQNQ